MLEILREPWPWYVAGPIIAVVMLMLLLFGKRFGLSSNLRTICSAVGAGKHCSFFDFKWKDQIWNLIFALGLVIGGLISAEFLSSDKPLEISQATISELSSFGLSTSTDSFLPTEIFSWESLITPGGLIMIVLGGFLVGFGTRYAGGCTSGHAISGLSDLQLPSLIAVIGFFIGGLTVTNFVLPYILQLL